jgi:hypothetical protein
MMFSRKTILFVTLPDISEFNICREGSDVSSVEKGATAADINIL